MKDFLQGVFDLLGFAKNTIGTNKKRANEQKYYATKKLRQKGIKVSTKDKVIYTKVEPTGYVLKWCKILSKFGYVQQTLLDL